MATEDEKVRERANRARARGQIAGKPKVRLSDVRQTTGNVGQAETRATFEQARKKVRGAARATGRVAGATAAEAGGVAGELGGGVAEGLGLKDKAAKAAEQGKSRAARGLSAAGRAARGAPGALLRGAGGLARAAGPALGIPAAAIGLAGEAASTPVDELPAKFSRLNPLSAVPTAAADFGLRKARGEGTREALGGAARGAIAPVSLGLVDQPEDDPFRGQKKTLGEFFTGDEAPGEQTPADPGLRAAAPPTGAPPAGAPPLGAPAAPAAPGGLRSAFTGRGAEVPPPGQGFIVGPGGQRTNVGTPAGLRQDAATAARTAEQPEQLQGTNRRTLDELEAGVDAGGIASAFGTLATGGNVLRQEAAERQQQRQLQQQGQRQNALLDVALVNAKADTANLPVKQKEQFNKTLDSIEGSIREATAANDSKALNRARSRAFQGAARDPSGPERVIANALVAGDIEDAFGPSLLADLGISSGRGFLDLLQNLGNQPTVPLDPSGQTFLDRETGNIMRPNAQGGSPQIVAGFSDLPDDTQDFFKRSGVLTSTRDKKGLRSLQAGGPRAAGVLR